MQKRLQAPTGITIIGETVTMGSLAASIEKKYHRAVRVICPRNQKNGSKDIYDDTARTVSDRFSASDASEPISVLRMSALRSTGTESVSGMTRVKICGLSRAEDIEAVNIYGADYAGFVFFEKSKRNVSYEKAEMLLKELKKNPNIQSVAVCVSPTKSEVKRMQNMGFDLIQIHGTIPADCQSDGGLALWQAVV